MASAIIHMAVAKVVKEKLGLKLNEKEYYLGSIAPDISKEINRSRDESHFIYDGKMHIEEFVNKYYVFLNKPFELGYLIHLYTDEIWTNGFLNEVLNNNQIKLLDGRVVELSNEEVRNIIYNDYSNMNILLLEEYNMDLSLFYEEFDYPVIHIEEIPNNLLNIIVNKIGIISFNSKLEKAYVFDICNIKRFIEDASNYCVSKINNVLSR